MDDELVNSLDASCVELQKTFTIKPSGAQYAQLLDYPLRPTSFAGDAKDTLVIMLFSVDSDPV